MRTVLWAVALEALLVLLVIAAVEVVRSWNWACTLIVVFAGLLGVCEFVAQRWDARTSRASERLAGPVGRRRVGL